MQSIELFITSLLKRGNIKSHNIQKILQYQQELEIAFVHESIDGKNNYKLCKIIGDNILPFSVIKYLREKYENITSVKILTRLRHTIISKKKIILCPETKIKGIPEPIKNRIGMILS